MKLFFTYSLLCFLAIAQLHHAFHVLDCFFHFGKCDTIVYLIVSLLEEHLELLLNKGHHVLVLVQDSTLADQQR